MVLTSRFIVRLGMSLVGGIMIIVLVRSLTRNIVLKLWMFMWCSAILGLMIDMKVWAVFEDILGS